MNILGELVGRIRDEDALVRNGVVVNASATGGTLSILCK